MAVTFWKPREFQERGGDQQTVPAPSERPRNEH